MKWELTSDAIISPCQRYRYWLTRTWEPAKGGMVFILFNPSVASVEIRDHTDRKCEEIARRLTMCGWYGIVNPFAFRATDPDNLKSEAQRPRGDAVGPENDEIIIQVLRCAKAAGDVVVAGWGTLGGQSFAKDRIADVVQQARHESVSLYCLGLTKEGHPRHPLMVSYKQPIEPLPADWTPPA